MLLAGCAGSAPAPQGSGSSSAPVPTLDDSTSSISGRVVDDEKAPLSGAEVGLVEARATTKSDEAGAFTFNGLAPGAYTLVAQKLGYDSISKKVTVTLEEVAQVSLELRPLSIAKEPYQITRQSTAYFKQSWYYVDRAAPIINQTSVYQQTCDPCVFHLFIEKAPKEGMTETYWKRAVTATGVNENIEPFYCIGWTVSCTVDGTLIWRENLGSRESIKWSQAGVDYLKKLDKLRLEVLAGFPGVMVQQRVDVYTSFSYLDGFPDNFTALPPEA